MIPCMDSVVNGLYIPGVLFMVLKNAKQVISANLLLAELAGKLNQIVHFLSVVGSGSWRVPKKWTRNDVQL